MGVFVIRFFTNSGNEISKSGRSVFRSAFDPTLGAVFERALDLDHNLRGT